MENPSTIPFTCILETLLSFYTSCKWPWNLQNYRKRLLISTYTSPFKTTWGRVGYTGITFFNWLNDWSRFCQRGPRVYFVQFCPGMSSQTFLGVEEPLKTSAWEVRNDFARIFFFFSDIAFFNGQSPYPCKKKKLNCTRNNYNLYDIIGWHSGSIERRPLSLSGILPPRQPYQQGDASNYGKKQSISFEII